MRNMCVALVALLAVLGCERSRGPVETGGGEPSAGSRVIDIQGAGATFPYPLYSKWIAEYEKVAPGVRINYQSIGSGGGIRQLIERTVDFGASDVPMSEEEAGRAAGPVEHIPITLGAVVLAYNLRGVSGLRLSPEAAAGIYLGEITTWNDPRIASLNPALELPADAIVVTYRSDGSGTTAVFTDYLARVSPAWRERVGVGKSVRFPTGLGAKGNEGVAGQVKTTPGAVGYVELAYATQTGLSHAAIRNRAGKFVGASIEGITAAAASMVGDMPEELRLSIVDPPGDQAYPISAFSYVLVYREQPDAALGRALARFLAWATRDGQRLGPALDYAPLPAEVVLKVEAKIGNLRAGGERLLGGDEGGS